MKFARCALVAAPLLLGACGGFGSAMTSHTDVVAKAAGKELRVEDAAQLLARNPQIPADPQVVQALADLWIEYTLLATAAAEDTTLSMLDLERMVEEERDQQTIMRYLETSVRVDTAFTDADLDRIWATEGPGVEIKARHILFRTSADATPEQRQQAQQRAQQAQQRAAGGADFAALAAETTEEPGGRERGGDLGWFGRGRMVAQFEEAAFGLRPDQVSPVVETPFGYHVIKVEDRRQQPIGDNRDMFRQQLGMQRRQQGLESYLDSLKAASSVEVQPGAVEQLRELAAQENLALRGRAASRTLVSFTGGEVTTGEVAQVLMTFGAQDRQAMADQAQARPEDLERFLEEQALRKVLLNEARTRNFRLSNAAVDSIRTEARQGVRDLLQMAGFAGRTFPRGRAGEGVIQEAVRNLMEQAVAGQRPIRPLGRLGLALRAAYPTDVNNGAFDRVAQRMTAIRAAQPQQPAPGFPPAGEGMGQPAPGQPVPGQP
jgi:peptidyl-prolyl cis-trans isomerase C